MVGKGTVEAPGQAHVTGGKLFQKPFADPQHDALGALRLWGGDGTVELRGGDEQQVAGLQVVDATVDLKPGLIPKEEIDHIKVVVVQFYLGRMGVVVVKHLEIWGVHLLSWVEIVGPFFHKKHLNVILPQDLQCVKRKKQLLLRKESLILDT